MANVLWASSLTNRADVLTTELNSLASGSFCTLGAAFDNTSNKDMLFFLEFLTGGSITPTTGAHLRVWPVLSFNGTDFGDTPASTQLAGHNAIWTPSIKTGAHTVRELGVRPILLPPCNIKFILQNNTGAAFSASGNVLRLWSAIEAVG